MCKWMNTAMEILRTIETTHASRLTPHALPHARIHYSLLTTHHSLLTTHYLTSFLYLIRCGWSSPSRFFLFSSYSLNPPSNQYTCEFPSNARMCVHTLSRNQRS